MGRKIDVFRISMFAQRNHRGGHRRRANDGGRAAAQRLRSAVNVRPLRKAQGLRMARQKTNETAEQKVAEALRKNPLCQGSCHLQSAAITAG